jgi:hypothetical protein
MQALFLSRPAVPDLDQLETMRAPDLNTGHAPGRVALGEPDLDDLSFDGKRAVDESISMTTSWIFALARPLFLGPLPRSVNADPSRLKAGRGKGVVPRSKLCLNSGQTRPCVAEIARIFVFVGERGVPVASRRRLAVSLGPQSDRLGYPLSRPKPVRGSACVRTTDGDTIAMLIGHTPSVHEAPACPKLAGASVRLRPLIRPRSCV